MTYVCTCICVSMIQKIEEVRSSKMGIIECGNEVAWDSGNRNHAYRALLQTKRRLVSKSYIKNYALILLCRPFSAFFVSGGIYESSSTDVPACFTFFSSRFEYIFYVWNAWVSWVRKVFSKARK